MATTRDELSDRVHRLSNYIECKCCELLPELLGEGRTLACTDLAYQAGRFVACLRNIRDNKEGGDE